MVQKVRIDGLRELEAALSALGKATGKNVLRRVLRARAQPIADAARAMAPDDPVTHGNDLRNSIGVSIKLSKRQAGMHRKMFKNDKASVEMFVGAGPLPQASLQEFGTANHGPQAYLRPSWDEGKAGILDGIKDDLWAEIDRAAKRKAKKAAREAARAAAEAAA